MYMHDLFMHQSQTSAYDLQIGSTWRKTYEGRNMLIMRSLFLFVREKEKKRKRQNWLFAQPHPQ